MRSTSVNSSTRVDRSKAGISQSASLDPRSPTLIQPFKRLVDEGFITELSVMFTPTGAQTFAKVDPRVVSVSGGTCVTDGKYPVALVARLADENNLIPKKGNRKSGGSQQKEAPLPSKSLTIKDFESDASIEKRSQEVAASIGGNGLIGRIGSGGLLPPQTMSFDDWWSRAGAEHRLQLLTSKDQREKIRKDLTAAVIDSRLTGLKCPFRETLEIRVSTNVEGLEEEEAAQAAAPATETTRVGSGSEVAAKAATPKSARKGKAGKAST